MQQKWILGGLLVLASMAGARAEAAPMTSSPLRLKQVAVFNKEKVTAAAIFAGATKVESFRIFARGQEKPQGEIQGFKVFGRGETQGHGFARRLGAIVLDAETYSLPGMEMKQCYFEPGVAFRVWKGKQFVDTVICFHCNELGVVENNPKLPIRSIGSILQGHMSVMGDFDSARPRLLALAKTAFKKDAAVQALH